MGTKARILASLTCPNCEAKIAGLEFDGDPPVATSFDACLRKCTKCGQVGASNTTNPLNVTYIYRNPLEAIPIESRAGAEFALKNALNERNRPSKWTKFGFFPTSEDAVTWVVFTYLLRERKLMPTLRATGVIADEQADAEPTLLLWGVPIDSDASGAAIREKLRSLCLSLGERSNSLSEPDVLIDLGDKGLVIIEVKHRSGNDHKDQDYSGWKTRGYLDAPYLNWSAEKVRATKLYELARNWCILNGLADGRAATLVNLGRSELFQGEAAKVLASFREAIGVSEARRFCSVTWNQWLAPTIDQAPRWLTEFCESWGVMRREKT